MKKKILLIIVLFLFFVLAVVRFFEYKEEAKKSYSYNLAKSYQVSMDSYFKEFGFYSMESVVGIELLGTNNLPVKVYSRMSIDLKGIDVEPYVTDSSYRVVLKIFNEKTEYWVIENNKDPVKIINY